MKRKRKGLTLVELIIASVLTTVVITLGFQTLMAIHRVTDRTMEETHLQMDVRLFTATLNTSVRYASALFTIPQKSFIPSKLTPGWNYLGVWENVTIEEPGKAPFVAPNAIVHLEYHATRPTHLNQGEQIIENAGAFFVQKVYGYTREDPKTGNVLRYDLNFSKPGKAGDDARIRYSLKASLYNSAGQLLNSKEYLSLDTELEALNSLQIVDKGTATNPSTAIAYRKDDRLNQYSANVAVVMDCSGSMEWSVYGNYQTSAIAERRITGLKVTAKQFIDTLSTNENINMGLIPFSNMANLDANSRGTSTRTQIFFSPKFEKDKLYGYIDSLQAVGGTNTADGIRYAYHALKDESDAYSKNYLVLLVDGDSNMWSYSDRNSWQSESDFFTGPGKAPFCGYAHSALYERLPNDNLRWYYSFRDWRESDLSERLMQSYLRNQSGRFSGFAKVYVILFTKSPSDFAKKSLKEGFSLNEDSIFRAEDTAKLNDAFQTIGENIKKDLWYLNGPEL